MSADFTVTGSFMSIDGGTPTADTGTAVPRHRNAHSDTGTPIPDTGTAVRIPERQSPDTGTAAPDTGTAALTLGH